MEIQFIYSKLRSEFGKQCVFSDRGPELIDNYPPDKRCRDRYIAQEPATKSTNLEPVLALHEANTEVIEYRSTQISHMEGGWPKDTAFNDPEQTDRYRRKAMKEDAYIHSCLSLAVPVEECIAQNCAVNIYQAYYSDVTPSPFVEQNNCRTVNVYKQPGGSLRPITNLSWSPAGTHVAGTYCDLRFQCPVTATSCYIWELENPNTPDIVLTADSPICFMEYNSKDQNLLACGFTSGQIGFFDIRRGTTPVMVSPIELAHRDPANQVHWIASKTNSEFFSGSTSGDVRWWDMRNNFQENTDYMIMDLDLRHEEPQFQNAVGISVLEYEHTMPTKFMFGTEDGKVVIINRKGKLMSEKLGGLFETQLGPVYSLQRNTAFLKNFLTIGDWTARIWAEDVRESCIVWTAYHQCLLRDAVWSTGRYSLFFTVRDDGIMDCWDVLQQQYAPIYSMKVSDTPLRKISCNANGKMVVLGTSNGTIYLIEVSDSMVQNTVRDKPFLTAMFDRESRREKILEARAREMKLLKQQAMKPGRDEEEEEGGDEEAEVGQAEAEYLKEVEKALAVYEAATDEPVSASITGGK